MIRSRSVGAAALLLAAASVACGLFDDPVPREARLVVEGDMARPVRIVVSRRFVAGRTEAGTTQVEIFVADTFDVALPFDRTFDIHASRAFFAQASPMEAGTQLRMRVMLDGRERFNESGTPAATNPFRFVYLFNRYFSSNIEVL